jgi:hypothetical protein
MIMQPYHTRRWINLSDRKWEHLAVYVPEINTPSFGDSQERGNIPKPREPTMWLAPGREWEDFCEREYKFGIANTKFENTVLVREVHMQGSTLPFPDLNAILMLKTDAAMKWFKKYAEEHTKDEVMDWNPLMRSFAGIGNVDPEHVIPNWNIPSLALWSGKAIISSQSRDFVSSYRDCEPDKNGNTREKIPLSKTPKKKSRKNRT